MDKHAVKEKQDNKKSVMMRFLEWIVRGHKKAAERGTLCRS